MTARRPDASVLALRHHKVQRLRRLLSRRSARESERAFVVEGAKLLREAIDAGAPVESVYLASGATDPVTDLAFAAGARVYTLEPGVIERISDTVSPQPVLAVVPNMDAQLGELSDANFLVVAIDVRDPGNAGTLLRSAEAAGAGGVVFCEGSVDVFNPKTVRASAGSLFHVPVVAGGNPVDVLQEIASWGVQRLGTVAAGGESYTDVDLTRRVAFVLGNEAHGLPSAVSAEVDQVVTIPMAGRSESLNVGMAAAVLCFETARQRRSSMVVGSS